MHNKPLMHNKPSLKRVLHLAVLFAGVAAGPVAGAESRTEDVRPVPPELWPKREVYGLDISFGGTYLGGNVENIAATGKLGFMLNFLQRHSVFVEGSANHSIFGDDVKIDKDAGSLLYAFAVLKHLNIYVNSTHYRNRFLELVYRTTNGGGLCYHGFGGRWLDPVLVSLGVTPENQWWNDGTSDFAVRGTLRFNVGVPLGAHVRLGADVSYAPVLRDPTSFRVYSEAYLEVKVLPPALSLRVTVSDEFDSRPRPGVKHNDVSVVPALEVHLGR